MYTSYHNAKIIYLLTQIYARCYNKHSITEYLINAISIYQRWFCPDGFEQARTTCCAVRIFSPSGVQYTIMSVFKKGLQRSHLRVYMTRGAVELRPFFWTLLRKKKKKWCFFFCHARYRRGGRRGFLNLHARSGFVCLTLKTFQWRSRW